MRRKKKLMFQKALIVSIGFLYLARIGSVEDSIVLQVMGAAGVLICAFVMIRHWPFK